VARSKDKVARDNNVKRAARKNSSSSGEKYAPVVRNPDPPFRWFLFCTIVSCIQIRHLKPDPELNKLKANRKE